MKEAPRLLVVSVLAVAAIISPLLAAGTGSYGISELFEFGNRSAASSNIPFVSVLAGGSTESAMPKSFDVDEDGSIIVNVSVSKRKGWEPVDAEGAFKKANGRKPASTDELTEWKKEHYLDSPPLSDDGKAKAWETYRSGPNQRHPGVRPVVEVKTKGLRVSPDGKLLERREGEIPAQHSTLLQPSAADDSLVAWFNANVPLPEYADRQREIKIRDGKEIKTHTQKAFFTEGHVLGDTRGGNRVYLMEISVPWNRPHIHGVSDFVDRVYVLSPDKKVLYSQETYPEIKMQKGTDYLFEIYSGPHKGLMPSLEDDRKQSWSVRRWRLD